MSENEGGLSYQPALHGRSRFARLARRTINGFAPVRWLVKSRFGHSLIYTLRVSRRVERPLAFAAGELRPQGVETIVLRDSGITAHVRRRSGDLVMLHQIIGRDVYRPPAEVEARLAEIEGPLRIVDLGANVGFFTLRQLERHSGCEVLAVEADPGNAAVLARTLEANDLGSRVELLDAAASNKPGTVEFAAGNFFQSHVVEAAGNGDGGVSTIEVPMVDVLPLLQGRDLLKIDIEGSEWPILTDERFRGLDACAVVLEWHSHGCPDPDPRAAAESALVAAGYSVSHDHSEPGCGTLWAWR